MGLLRISQDVHVWYNMMTFKWRFNH